MDFNDRHLTPSLHFTHEVLDNHTDHRPGKVIDKISAFIYDMEMKQTWKKSRGQRNLFTFEENKKRKLVFGFVSST